jgi:predicted amidohydrolase YtcJ
MVCLSHEAGLQVAFHAIGDAALEQCISAVEKVMERDPKPLRHRIVHCQIGNQKLYERMASLGMGADIQPPFTASDAPLVDPRLGKKRMQESYAWKMLQDAGVLLGGGSDSPVEAYEPLWGIYCAVTREDGHGAPPWMPEQCLTIEEAVELYTKGPAQLALQEAHSGTLEAGKLADLVVLDRDIFRIPSEEIIKLRIELTMMGGQITYRLE